ncbi:MAG: M48 family metalloprotease [Gammaproteobacteria bacterium]|nr:M48 family metalloprotease [Gammaproteobacteria bacterium]
MYKIKHPLIALTLITSSFLLSHTAFSADENFRLRAHQNNADINTLSDIEAEIKFGNTVSARILGQFKEYDNEKLKRYVSLVGKSLAMNSSRDEIEFHFSILDADFINAYSAPGGYVFITKGAIKAMRDESELAAVLAHEIAHITEKHIIKEFKIRGQDNSATAGISNLLGSSSSSAKVAFTQSVDNAVNKLLNKGFKKDEELNADKVALLLLATTGYDPSSMQRYLKRIKKITNKTKPTKHKPTHPPTSQRIKSLQSIAKQEGLDKLKLPKAKSRFKKYVKI